MIKKKLKVLLIAPLLLLVFNLSAQEVEQINLDSFSNHNQIFFNRFLINPAFSYVRQEKSYLNFLHKNKHSTFEDNDQNYFIGYNNKFNNQSAYGLGIHLRTVGVVDEFGVDANYAKSVLFSEKSSLTLGVNLTYLSSGLSKNRLVLSANDDSLATAVKENTIAFQPGVVLSLGKFDFGVYGKNLIRYNQRTNALETNLSLNSLKGQLQYSLNLGSVDGVNGGSVLTPLVQIEKSEYNGLQFAGSLLYNAPKLGWFQSTVGKSNGMSLGLGIYLGKKMMFGYLLERNLFDDRVDLGWNHELTLAYTIKDDLTTNQYSQLSESDELLAEVIRNYEEQIAELKEKKSHSKASPKKENSETLSYLVARQDSLEQERTLELERRFKMLVRVVRNEIREGLNTKITEDRNEELTTSNAMRNRVTTSDFILEDVPHRLIQNSGSIMAKSGYYLIVNVFKDKNNMHNFMNRLKDKGINANHFYNSENNLNYVYLDTFDAKITAKTAYVSDWGGKYKDDKWILEIQNNTDLTGNHFSDNN